MTVVTVRGTTLVGVTGTTWAATGNAIDGAVGTTPDTYATWTTNVTSAVGTLEVGFPTLDLGAVESVAVVTLSARGFTNNPGRLQNTRYQFYSGGTPIGVITAFPAFAGVVGAPSLNVTGVLTAAQLNSSLSVRFTWNKAATTQQVIVSFDHAELTVDYVATPPAITQASYGFYADGTETGATALAAQDTTPTVDTSGGDVNAQMRLRLQSTTAVAVGASDDFQLQWEKNTSGTWADVVAAEVLIDRNIAAATNSFAVYLGRSIASQTFAGNGSRLDLARFWMFKSGTTSGTMTAVLHATSGGIPTGSPLATSTAVDVSTLTGTFLGASQWVDFHFDGTYTPAAGTTYAIGLQFAGGDASNAPRVAVGASGSHSGSLYLYSTVWTVQTTELLFQIYTTPLTPASTVLPFDSANLADGAATTSRLTGGTGTFTAGKVSEDGLADDVGWAGNNHTEILYSLTLKAADLTAGDTLRFRVLRNGATTGVTYTQTPTVTIGGGGPADKPIAGTVAGTSTTAGAPTAVHPMGGSVAAATATAGAIEKVGGAQDYPLAGTLTATTTTAGAIAAVHPLAGILPATSTTTGALARLNLALAATVTAVGLVSGAPTAVHPLGGTLPATSSTAGSPAAAHPLVGAASGATTTSGAIAAVHPAAGTVTATSTTAGNPTANHPLTSTNVPAVTATSGTINLVGGPQIYPLAGLLPATTTTAGSIGVKLTANLAGTVTATTTSSGSPTARHPLAGLLPATTTTAGSLAATGGRPKIWTGSTWASKPGKVWTGAVWVEKPWKRWDGTAWKRIT